VIATDNTIMAQVRDGEVRNLAVLFERHHKQLFNFFLRMTSNRDLSEDLVQDVFFRMLRYRHTYNETHPFTAWMYQIARNAQTDHLRKRRPEAPIEIRSGEEVTMNEPVSTIPLADERLHREQQTRLLRRALDRLPTDKREILILSRFQNLKYDEIAAVLGCEVNSVKVRVYRATKALGDIYFQLAGARAS
jgi:RNA polymerase sigma factor (sigma-70 family)